MKINLDVRYFIYGLPFVILLFWTGKLELDMRRGQRLALPIVGYDPRDLIAGHFVEFRLDLGNKDPCKNQAPTPGHQTMCLCWRAGDVATLEWAKECGKAIDPCDIMMQGTCRQEQFMAGIERFYIPEMDAPFLRQIPDGSKIVVRVTKDGRSFADELQPEGDSYARWIKKMRAKGKD